MLVELSVMEQRYQAVLGVVQDGWQVSEVARRLGVSRQSVHSWITPYETGGLRRRATTHIVVISESPPDPCHRRDSRPRAASAAVPFELWR